MVWLMTLKHKSKKSEAPWCVPTLRLLYFGRLLEVKGWLDLPWTHHKRHLSLVWSPCDLPVMSGPDHLIKWQNHNLGIIIVKLMFESDAEFYPRNKVDARKGGHRGHEDCFLQIFPYNQKQLSKRVAVWCLKVKLLLIQTMDHLERWLWFPGLPWQCWNCFSSLNHKLRFVWPHLSISPKIVVEISQHYFSK